jgi:hypothetical protein
MPLLKYLRWLAFSDGGNDETHTYSHHDVAARTTLAAVTAKVLQVSIPRGGSNAVARMMEQSPSIAAVLRGRAMETGYAGFASAIQQVQAQVPGGLPYVKELAAFLGDEEFGAFDRRDRFLVAVRDPAQQVASTILAMMRNTGLLQRQLGEVRGRPVTEAELGGYLAAHARDFDGWADLLGYVRRTHDFEPLADPLAELFGAQPARESCESGVEWFERSLFDVGALSWSRSVDLVERLRRMRAWRLVVLDFSVLQTRPELIAEVCDRLDLRYHPRMAAGPWRPASRWFTSGLELSDGDHWVGKAQRSRVLERPSSVPYDPLTLPPPARDTFLSGLAGYLRLLADPALVWPRTAADVEQLCNTRMWRREDSGYVPDDHHKTFATKNPVAAWCLATTVAGAASAPVRAVEAANPYLAGFFAVARELAGR